MEDKPVLHRRTLVYVTIVVTVVVISSLMATRSYTSHGPVLLTMTRPGPRESALTISETIRRGQESGSNTLRNRAIDGLSAVGRSPSTNMTSYPIDGGKKKTKKYYMGLSCPKEKARPGDKLPKIALASFPRAGNGWTRHLIQYATGLYVGSQGWTNRAKHSNKDTFPASGKDVENGRVIVIKTHMSPTPDLNKEAILLIRNPYRSIVSDVYKRVFLRRKFSKKEMIKFFKTDDWVREVTRLAKSWKGTATNWIADSKRLLVVSNERLFENTERELTKIIDFLHQPIDKKRIQCAVKNYYPLATSARFNIDPYTEELRTLLDSCIEEVNRTLSEHKLPTLPTFDFIPSY